MTPDEARILIYGPREEDKRLFGFKVGTELVEPCETRTNFDYLATRKLAVDIGGDTFWPGVYNRENGANMAERVVNELRKRYPAPAARAQELDCS